MIGEGEKENEFIPVKKAYWEVKDIQQRTNQDDFISKREYKKQREQWVASVFMRGIEKLTKKDWFLQMQYNDPPDFKTVSKNEEAEGNKKYDEAEVEILFVPKNTANKFNNNTFSTDLAEFIVDNKIRNKAYLSTYILVIYGNFTRIGVDLNVIRNNIKEANPKLGQIWMLSCVDSTKVNYKIFELFRDSREQEINIVLDFVSDN